MLAILTNKEARARAHGEIKCSFASAMATWRSTLLILYFLPMHFLSIFPNGQIINIHPNEQNPDDQRDYGCRPGFKYETLKGAAPKCEKCGSLQFYCINGEAKEVSPGYYSVGGKWNMRTGQSKCGGNEYYCVDGKRNEAESTQYTTGGTELTRTGVAICTQIKNCDVPETCTTATDQKCERCKEDTTRVQAAGKPDECNFVVAGIKPDDALDEETCGAASGKQVGLFSC